MASKRMKYPSKASASNEGKKSRKALSAIRNSLRPLLRRANSIISQLKREGLENESYAISEAVRTRSRAKGVNQEELFSLDDKVRYRDLVREANRIEAFLSNPEISPRVVEYNRQYSDRISFQNQAETFEATGHRFDVDDQDRMKLALRIFRDIATTETSVIGRDAYGSDNLINLIYDELEGYSIYNAEEDNDLIQERVYDIAYSSIENYKVNTMWGFLEGTPTINRDVNIVQELRKSMTTDEFFNRNPFLRTW